VLELHKQHFVEDKGMDAVRERIEARRREGIMEDKKMAREHRGRLMSLHAEIDHKFKHSMKFGSASIWTKEERDRIEERRHDPDEARQKMTQHMKELSKTYCEEKAAMTARVWAKPSMNVRSKAEKAKIEESRQDPEEAMIKMQQHMEDRAKSFKEEKEAMMARIQASPRTTFWSEDKKAQLEELRRDPDEAHQRMETHLRSLKKAWDEDLGAMTSRVNASPAMSFWSPEQRREIEDARQDPQEATTQMTQHMKDLERTTKERKKDMLDRVSRSPRKTFWTPEEKSIIEEVRRNPEEAHQKAAEDMRELAWAYRQEKKGIMDRVNAIPKKTFERPEVTARRKYAEELRKQNALRGKGGDPL